MAESPVAVAMSGGVDSSVVAGMMVRGARPVIGLTMQLWNQRRLPEMQVEGATGRCCSLDDVYDARAVAQHVGIPYYVVNFESRFEEQVVKPFVDDYLAGRTPIPCTLCNNFIKFDQFLEMAAGVGADTIATGHYARISQNEISGRWEMRRGVDTGKDQTYFLFGLTQDQLSRTLFPLGGLTKPQVRELAREMGISVADKNDSQEICFVPNGDYAAFIDAYFKEQGIETDRTRGEIVTSDGAVIGEHGGVHRFTIGQRRGLGISSPEPFYVIQTDPSSQRVVVGRNEDLLCSSLTATRINWISIAPPMEAVRAEVKIRNKHAAAAATLIPCADGDSIEVVFDESQRAVTPGQAAVFYRGDLVLGGGWIS
ncbi:MAG: tRNA 2-thiouridine(34) synthase MnmA [Bryobacteraceae bacterium]|nr:tRNA 2-thiouridine(34) synthase MnmA [Bryobacteraceae bacterium]